MIDEKRLDELDKQAHRRAPEGSEMMDRDVTADCEKYFAHAKEQYPGLLFGAIETVITGSDTNTGERYDEPIIKLWSSFNGKEVVSLLVPGYAHNLMLLHIENVINAYRKAGALPKEEK